MLNSSNAYSIRAKHLAEWTAAFVVLGGISFFVGCGGTYPSSAYGVVTLDGRTVPRGAVAFQPVGGGASAYGLISDDGKYVVRTGREDGLPSGDYQVTVTANEAPSAADVEKGLPPPPGKAITPAWYRMKETSGLKFNVKPGKNEINLELTSKPPAGSKSVGQKQG
jgi:hypothetical protein